MFKRALSILLFPALSMAATTDPVKIWKRAGFANAEFSTITVPDAPTEAAAPSTHALDATIVMFRNTGWTKDSIEAHLKRTNEIYAQCGIKLGEIKFVETDAYQGKLDINERWTEDGDDNLIASATPLEKRPVIYLMRSILPKRGTEGAFTNIQAFWVPLPEKSYNTIWISNVIHDPMYSSYRDIDNEGRVSLKFRDPSYDVVAHEIAHLLANMGHETELKQKNLLNGSSSEINGDLLPRQCEKFKQSPLIRKL